MTNIKRNNAESKALSILRAVTKNWPLVKMSKVGGGGGNGGGNSDKDIGVRLSNLSFPNPGNIKGFPQFFAVHKAELLNSSIKGNPNSFAR